jgi:hypothetical protein
MQPDELSAHWRKTYSGVPPLGYYLREFYHDAWMRIPSFSWSKQHAEERGDEQEVAFRHDAVLASMFREDPRHIVILTGYTSEESPFRDYPQLEADFSDASYFLHCAWDGEDYHKYFFFRAARLGAGDV